MTDNFKIWFFFIITFVSCLIYPLIFYPNESLFIFFLSTIIICILYVFFIILPIVIKWEYEKDFKL